MSKKKYKKDISFWKNYEEHVLLDHLAKKEIKRIKRNMKKRRFKHKEFNEN
jgi:hypothetical protein